MYRCRRSGPSQGPRTSMGPAHGLDAPTIRSALDAALLTDAELSLGQEGWTAVPDPLLGSAGTG